MNKILTAVKDLHTGYTDIATYNSEGSALRAWQVIKDSDATIKAFPNDFELVKLGEYDSETGKIEPCEPHIMSVGEYNE